MVQLGISAGSLRRQRQISNAWWWMGCKVAVYDFTIQEKPSMMGESSKTGSHRKNRRGSRSRNAESRKRRRVITAAPQIRVFRRPPGSAFVRSSYMWTRRQDWAKMRAFKLGRMKDCIGKMKRRRAYDVPVKRGFVVQYSPKSREEVVLRRHFREACLRWSMVSALASHEPVKFALIRLRVLLQVVTEGYDSFPMPVYSDGLLQREGTESTGEVMTGNLVPTTISPEVYRRAKAVLAARSSRNAGNGATGGPPKPSGACLHRTNHVYCSDCGGCILRDTSCKSCLDNPRRATTLSDEQGGFHRRRERKHPVSGRAPRRLA